MFAVRLATLSALSLMAGCTRPLPPPPNDTGTDIGARLDAPETDAPETDAPLDAPLAIDAPAGPDASDASLDVPPDVPPDVPTDTGVDAPSRCDLLYGDLPGYVLCAEGVDRCTMAITLAGDDCNIACNSAGERCVSAMNDGPVGMECSGSGSWACGQNGMSAICTCGRR